MIYSQHDKPINHKIWMPGSVCGKYLQNDSRKFHVCVLVPTWDLRHFVMPHADDDTGIWCLLVFWSLAPQSIKKELWRNDDSFLHSPFLLSFGSGFRALVAASPPFFRRWYSRVAAFPTRGRYPKGADRVTMTWKTAGIRFPGHS